MTLDFLVMFNNCTFNRNHIMSLYILENGQLLLQGWELQVVVKRDVDICTGTAKYNTMLSSHLG